jgi:glutamate---cysteine ligase / carboxylate-amine ligase
VHASEILTFGVEEEFLLIDPATGQVAPAVDAVLAELPVRLRGQVQREFLTSQVEIATDPQTDLAALRDRLLELRLAVSAAAERAGVRVIAAGTCPVACPPPPVVDEPRYHRMVREFGAPLAAIPGLCACHVHVGVPDRALGVRVLSQLRRWLPVLQAATGNSPYYAGKDTGYSSWRSVLWARWPTAGPPPHLETAEDYDQVVDALTASGAMFDDGMLYWYARLSAHVPTLEVRVGDVCPTVDDTVLIAALVRALVATAVTDLAQGRADGVAPHWLVSAAHWLAARDGLDGCGLDVGTGSVRPAWDLMNELVEHVRPALSRHGDEAAVGVLADRLAARGTGAARQRRALAAGHDFAAVTTFLTREVCRDDGWY